VTTNERIGEGPNNNELDWGAGSRLDQNNVKQDQLPLLTPRFQRNGPGRLFLTKPG